MNAREYARLRSVAAAHFAKAAACVATSEDPDALALALIEGGLGLTAVAQLDDDCSARDRALAYAQLQAARARA
jgi:hypothetical protein